MVNILIRNIHHYLQKYVASLGKLGFGIKNYPPQYHLVFDKKEKD